MGNIYSINSIDEYCQILKDFIGGDTMKNSIKETGFL